MATPGGRGFRAISGAGRWEDFCTSPAFTGAATYSHHCGPLGIYFTRGVAVHHGMVLWLNLARLWLVGALSSVAVSLLRAARHRGRVGGTGGPLLPGIP